MSTKEISKSIPFIGMAIFILLISVGLNISKMKCTDDGVFYLGTEVPSCSLEEEVVCEKEQEKVSCCLLDIEKSCCPEMQDKSCASETENIHFNFETLLSYSGLNFKLSPKLISFKSNYLFSETLISEIKYFSGIPPPKLNKPDLSKIQSFLL